MRSDRLPRLPDPERLDSGPGNTTAVGICLVFPDCLRVASPAVATNFSMHGLLSRRYGSESGNRTSAGQGSHRPSGTTSEGQNHGSADSGWRSMTPQLPTRVRVIRHVTLWMVCGWMVKLGELAGSTVDLARTLTAESTDGFAIWHRTFDHAADDDVIHTPPSRVRQVAGIQQGGQAEGFTVGICSVHASVRGAGARPAFRHCDTSL